MAGDLISRSSRSAFRDLMTGMEYARIGTAFEDELFAPEPFSTYEDSSVRRKRTQQYLEAVDWTNPDHIRRVLRVFERLTVDTAPEYAKNFFECLRRDGYVIDQNNGHIRPAGPMFPSTTLGNLSDPSAIHQQLARIQQAVIDDPALAIGSAKELIESTAKVVLTEVKVPFDDKDDLPALAKKAQQALGLHSTSASPGPDGTDAVKKILGAVSTIAMGLAELRNRGYGTGHGPASTPKGLGPRHAHLAVNAAFTWCQLMLDTLQDPSAPWRTKTAP